MVGSVNTTRFDIALPRQKVGQAVDARVPELQNVEKSSDTVRVFTDYSLGVRVTEVLHPETGVLISQSPSGSTLYTLQSEHRVEGQVERPALVSSSETVEQNSFDPFFQTVEEKIEDQYAALTQEHAAYAAAAQSAIQSGQPDIRLLNESV